MLDKKYIKSMIVTLLLLIGGWASFTLLKLVFQKLLIKIGIHSEILQVLVMLLIVVGILFLMGYGIKKSIKKMLG